MSDPDEMVDREFTDINRMLEEIIRDAFGEEGTYLVALRVTPDDPEDDRFADAEVEIDVSGLKTPAN